MLGTGEPEADEEFCQILAAALANNDTYGLKDAEKEAQENMILMQNSYVHLV